PHAHGRACRRVPGSRPAAGTCRRGEIRALTAGRRRSAGFAGEERWANAAPPTVLTREIARMPAAQRPATPTTPGTAPAPAHGHLVGPAEPGARMAEGMQPCRSREDGRRP